ncbi:hypothetical protein [Alienimonas chondri]|uniref:Uncharacterized protein n=1 Tax=Alienimonas chondri TaxID=2681879 RepID=A0ABX1VCH0_9PLAN|nr:hypothetical protein [Alienimonas chondri]NNJ25813.1 hypothetical protein [Alienimonas chondri]
MPAAPVLIVLSLCSADPNAGTTTGPDPVAMILGRWEAAAAHRVPISDADRAATRLAHPNASEELLALMATLRGPISAESLAREYEWRVHGLNGSHPTLSGVPRDPIARAFTPRLSVAMRENFLPVRMWAEDAPADDPPYGKYVRGEMISLDAFAFGTPRFEQVTPVIRAQNLDADAESARRPPIRTALFTQPAGDVPTWTLQRRIKKTAVPRLVNDRQNRQPLTAPRP